ncbi:MAG TPA: tannase/feruloyl esterase family alpha/beta hydrolase [Candidatus Cybelea sp.]|nr:tannase/feruloyl esterase family alpha/beta hydrolase [Candidatus Cybelea sp.]
MMVEKRRRFKPKLSVSLVGLGAVAGVTLAAAPAMADCSVAGITALGVPNVTITSAVDTPATTSLPEFCAIKGTVTTTGHGAPDGSAIFLMDLPANWNHKLLGLGNGGFAGSASLGGTQAALIKGYALVDSDTGHEAGSTDARWSLNPDGTPNEAALTDYYFRAVHEVTVAAKALTEAFYAQGKVKHAYFDSCSNGGRQALMEASRFPDDYDGIIAGDPFMSIRSIAAGPGNFKQLMTPQTFIPAGKNGALDVPGTFLKLIDQATTAACDAADGVQDGLIQNPAACNFKPQTLVCASGQTSGCIPGFTQGMADSLTKYFSAARDDDGNVVYNGASISDLSGRDGAPAWTFGFFSPGDTLPTGGTFDLNAQEPWGGIGFGVAPAAWQFVDHAIQFFVERNPNFNMRTFDGTLPTPLSDAALTLFDQRTEAGDADDPAKLDKFIRKDHKLLMYHGFSDPALTAFRSIQYYQDLAGMTDGGIPEVQENVRLFLAPGMHHCGGGPGPNVFDTLTALEGWVERGIGPDGIIAAKFVNDNPALGVMRTMPLCKFPEMAHFNGDPTNPAQVNDAGHWTCSPHDRSLLTVGLNGRMAGLGGKQAAEFNDDRHDHDHGDGDHHGDDHGDRD